MITLGMIAQLLQFGHWFLGHLNLALLKGKGGCHIDSRAYSAIIYPLLRRVEGFL
jgi:hypothetical protein